MNLKIYSTRVIFLKSLKKRNFVVPLGLQLSVLLTRQGLLLRFLPKVPLLRRVLRVLLLQQVHQQPLRVLLHREVNLLSLQRALPLAEKVLRVLLLQQVKTQLLRVRLLPERELQRLLPERPGLREWR